MKSAPFSTCRQAGRSSWSHGYQGYPGNPDLWSPAMGCPGLLRPTPTNPSWPYVLGWLSPSSAPPKSSFPASVRAVQPLLGSPSQASCLGGRVSPVLITKFPLELFFSIYYYYLVLAYSCFAMSCFCCTTASMRHVYISLLNLPPALHKPHPHPQVIAAPVELPVSSRSSPLARHVTHGGTYMPPPGGTRVSTGVRSLHLCFYSCPEPTNRFTCIIS